MDEHQFAEDAPVVCRICFEGEEAGALVSPCQCRGTQGTVHEACLYKWRQLQVLQDKLSAATRCEICGSKYASSLSHPSRPVRAVASEFGRVLFETLLGLAVYIQKSFLIPFLVFTGFPTWHFGFVRVAGTLLFVVSSLVFLLYTKGIKLSVLDLPGNKIRLSFTCFGPPIDGLCSGMLLVSIRAGGPFRRTVLYVLEHHDFGSLALILNKTPWKEDLSISEHLNISVRDGGPVQTRACFCIHDVEGVPGSERVFRGESLFLDRGRVSLQVLKAGATELARHTADAHPRRAILFKGVSSWGERQLEGELRRSTWGWIRPEHVKPEDVLEVDPQALGGLWERLSRSPHLQVFQDPYG